MAKQGWLQTAATLATNQQHVKVSGALSLIRSNPNKADNKGVPLDRRLSALSVVDLSAE